MVAITDSTTPIKKPLLCWRGHRMTAMQFHLSTERKFSCACCRRMVALWELPVVRFQSTSGSPENASG